MGETRNPPTFYYDTNNAGLVPIRIVDQYVPDAPTWPGHFIAQVVTKAHRSRYLRGHILILLPGEILYRNRKPVPESRLKQALEE